MIQNQIFVLSFGVRCYNVYGEWCVFLIKEFKGVKMQEGNRDYSMEIVKAIESGVHKHLDSSITYTPFKLFYAIFKATNPKMMNNVKGVVRNDIYNRVTAIPDFDFNVFINGAELTPKGKQLLQISFNIGIHLLKKDLNVASAFKVVTNAAFRSHIYSYVLDVVSRSASRVLHHAG